jgi:Ca-activated chloride channel family protein
MSFLWPPLLLLLLLIPPGVWLYVRAQRRRQQLARNFSRLGLTSQASRLEPAWRRHLPASLFLLAFAFLIVALARPQAAVSLPRLEGVIMLVFDVSGSMAATDVEPTRLEAAKVVARDFVMRQPDSVRIGVVAFSDGGLTVQAPTNDRATVIAAINRLKPERGTSLGSGILAALNALKPDESEPLQLSDGRAPSPTPTPLPRGQYAPALIVLLTDGENNESPDPLAAAQTAAERGVRLYPIGFGSPAGTTLEVNGFSIFTQLNEPLLRQIAQATGGAYYNAAEGPDLSAVSAELNSQLVIKTETLEVTSLVAGAGLLVLLSAGGLSLLWFGRLP